jgi:hypothetical protein
LDAAALDGFAVPALFEAPALAAIFFSVVAAFDSALSVAA